MKLRSRQTGITLVMSLIMLVVLTLLAAAAIRFGNVNLKIAGNAQSELEASSAAQVAIDQTLATINTSPDIALVAAQTVTVATGGKSYSIAVTKPACILTRNVLNTELSETAQDQKCFDEGNREPLLDQDLNPIPQPTACKGQQWTVTATSDSDNSGAKVTMLQGVAVRVGAQVACP